MKKIIILCIAVLLISAGLPLIFACASSRDWEYDRWDHLSGLEWDSDSIGGTLRMEPDFDPYILEYTLTTSGTYVAFYPYMEIPPYHIDIDGEFVDVGERSHEIQKRTNPQRIEIEVSASGGSNTYIINVNWVSSTTTTVTRVPQIPVTQPPTEPPTQPPTLRPIPDTLPPTLEPIPNQQATVTTPPADYTTVTPPLVAPPPDTASPTVAPPTSAPPADPCAGADSYDFSIPCARGGVINLSDYRGRPVAVWLFASWCDSAVSMIPHMKILSSDYLDTDIYVLLGAVMPGYKGEVGEAEWENAQRITLKTLPILLDTSKWFYNTFGDKVGIPSVIIFNECGEYVETYSGLPTFHAIEERMMELFPWITQGVRPQKFIYTDCPYSDTLQSYMEDYYFMKGRRDAEFVSVSWDPENPDCAMVCFDCYSTVYTTVGNPYERHWYEYTYFYYSAQQQDWLMVAWDTGKVQVVSKETWRGDTSNDPGSSQDSGGQTIDTDGATTQQQDAMQLRQQISCDGVDSMEFALPTIGGETVRLSDYRGQKPVVVWLFGNTCTISKGMYDDIKILACDFLGHGEFTLLGAMMPDIKTDMDAGVLAVLQQWTFPTIPIMLDEGHWFYHNAAGAAVPSVLIFDECGRFVEAYSVSKSGARTFDNIGNRIRELFPWIRQDDKPVKHTDTNCPFGSNMRDFMNRYYPNHGQDQFEFVSISWDPDHYQDYAMICYDCYETVHPADGDPYERHWYEYTYFRRDDTAQWGVDPLASETDPEEVFPVKSANTWTEAVGTAPQTGSDPPPVPPVPPDTNQNANDVPNASFDLYAKFLWASFGDQENYEYWDYYGSSMPNKKINFRLSCEAYMSGGSFTNDELPIKVGWYINGEKQLENTFYAINGYLMGPTVDWTTPWSGGEFTIACVVDCNNEFQEADETNNVVYNTFVVDEICKNLPANR